MVLPCLPCLAVAPALGSLVLPTAAASGVGAAFYIRKSKKNIKTKKKKKDKKKKEKKKKEKKKKEKKKKDKNKKEKKRKKKKKKTLMKGGGDKYIKKR